MPVCWFNHIPSYLIGDRRTNCVKKWFDLMFVCDREEGIHGNIVWITVCFSFHSGISLFTLLPISDWSLSLSPCQVTHTHMHTNYDTHMPQVAMLCLSYCICYHLAVIMKVGGIHLGFIQSSGCLDVRCVFHTYLCVQLLWCAYAQERCLGLMACLSPLLTSLSLACLYCNQKWETWN